jgi:hypothetical protein
MRQREGIELQSTDELAFKQLVGVLSESTCRVCPASRESPFRYFHHCRFSGSNEHIEQAWVLIAERLGKEGWVRLDNPRGTTLQGDHLMYFGIPSAKRRAALRPKT